MKQGEKTIVRKKWDETNKTEKGLRKDSTTGRKQLDKNMKKVECTDTYTMD